MASRYPPSWLEELRSRCDLVQVVSGYVSLKKNGRRYWGLCPFHGEKTASFSVDSEAQLYYCFGCKAGGSVFTFVQEMEHLSFQEAVELLADRAHMRLPELVNDADYEARRERRQRLLDANREAARWFHETLFTPAGADALEYLRGRGLNDAVIRKFGLGAAPDRWNALTRHLTEQGYTLEELQAANLTAVREAEPGEDGAPARPRRVYDVFRGRVMFPVIDQYGNVIAFSGRILEKGGERKYLNTSDTPVFNKRKNVFGANLLRKERHLDRVILVEGNLDVVSLTQFGIRGVCATLGTALTPEQAQLLRRFAPEVCLAYDGDAAGQHAILKGLDLFRDENIPCRVLEFPGGMDPDDFIRREGAEKFRSLPLLSPEAYRIRRLRESLDLSSREGKVAYARQAVSIIAGLDPVERDGYLRDLALQTGFTRDVLDEQLRSELQKLPRQDPWAGKPAPSGARKDPLSVMGAEDPGPAPSAGKETRPLTETDRKILRAEEMLLSLAATGLLPEDLCQEEDFSDPELKYLYRDLKAGASPASLIERGDEGDRSRLTRLLMPPQASGTDELIAMAQECVSVIRRGAYEKKLKEIEERMPNCTDEAERLGLLSEYQALTETLRKL